MKDRQFGEGKFGIIIIESLASSDKKTGETLFNETLKYLKFKFPDLVTELRQVQSVKEFENVMSEIFKRTSKNNFIPLIQIESHGSTEGIQLSSGEIVEWEKFFALTRKINIAIKNTLVISLALCEGGSLIGKFDPDLRAPFFAVIASFKKIGESDMLNAYEKFYENFFGNQSILNAVEKMNEQIPSDTPTFYLLKADQIFDAMLDKNRDPDFFDKMVNEQAVLQKATNPNFQNMSFEIVKMKVRNRMQLIYRKAKENKGYFMMKDLR